MVDLAFKIVLGNSAHVGSTDRPALPHAFALSSTSTVFAVTFPRPIVRQARLLHQMWLSSVVLLSETVGQLDMWADAYIMRADRGYQPGLSSRALLLVQTLDRLQEMTLRYLTD